MMKLVSQLSFDIRHSLFIIRYSLFGSGLSGLWTGEEVAAITTPAISHHHCRQYLYPGNNLQLPG
jgi:hypothetical protein